MTNIFLSPGKIRKLKKESAKSTYAYSQLCREAIAGRWLAEHRIPCWRNPVSPPAEYGTGVSRYSIMLADGSRFMVCRSENAVLSFDAVAAAKCFAVVGISLSEHCSGKPEGHLLLRDMVPGVHRYDFTGTRRVMPSSFSTGTGTAGGYLAQLLKFSIRLLILGEPDAPVRGTENIMAFQPAERREV